MEKKQTAVEWLQEKLDNYDFCNGRKGYRELIKQAKEIERQQIIDAVVFGQHYGTAYPIDAANYFKLTYGKDA